MFYEHERPTAEKVKKYNTRLPPPNRSLNGMMDTYLRARHLDPTLAESNGWFPSTQAGDGVPRIVMPATSKIQGNVYWQARSMTDELPRYQSPFATRGDAIILVWPNTRTFKQVTHGAVVEGPMDALAAAGAGPVLGVALMGVMPPWIALDLTVIYLYGKMTFLVIDRDAGGPAVTRTYPYLVSRKLDIRIVDPYPAKDLAAMTVKGREELLQ